MTHLCTFELDKDGQVTCLICGARNNKKEVSRWVT